MTCLSVIVICAGIATIVILWDLYEGYKYRMYDKISFKEALDLTDLPIITFDSNGKKLNFLLDTGSDSNHINKVLLDNDEIEYESTNHAVKVLGMEGNKREVNIVKINMSLNDKQFSSTFLSNDLSKSFNAIKTTCGVTIHGILGTSFFNKYKYVIDFDRYVAYSKRK